MHPDEAAEARVSEPPRPSDAQLDACIAPTAPNDDLAFEELARRYNFQQTSNRLGVFVRLLIRECEERGRPLRTLDIGCGEGMGQEARFHLAVKRYVDEVWGVEPDTTTRPADGLFEHFQQAMMEDAELPADHFDLAYSCMVMEHVADPDAFMQAVYRVLKPGGVYYFMTPNGRHYFSRLAKLSHVLRIEEVLLPLLLGRKQVESYHYPVQYRINTTRQIDRCAARIGFEAPEYVFMEQIGPKPYFPGPLRLFFHAMRMKRMVWKNPHCLLDLICRVRKPTSA